MRRDDPLLKRVKEAKTDIAIGDMLIRDYLPFIKSEIYKYTQSYVDESQDEFSIGMIAFHEAVMSYDEERGSFLGYAAACIRNRLIDNDRKETRHKDQISLDKRDEDDNALGDIITDGKDHAKDHMHTLATKEEIEELGRVLKEFGVSYRDVTEASPSQKRTRELMQKLIAKAMRNKDILEDLLKTKRLPMKKLAGDKNERKVIDRHRKYLVAMLVILTNGYEIIRGHLWHVYKGGEEL